MASKMKSYTFLLLALSTLSFIVNSSIAEDCVGSGAISTYWGQHKDDATEGTLKETCDSGFYKIVILESLIVYDDGQTPEINFANHCGPQTTPCSKLEETIKHCQDLDIKVFLSIGLNQSPVLASSNSSLLSDDASPTKVLADYLLENFFSGNSGPLGSVFLDGIDIVDEVGAKNLPWDELVKVISEVTSVKKIYLSAAPQCVYPDYYLGPAIATGLFDYIWVEFFYQNPCIYADGSADNLVKEWNKWTSGVPNSKIFLGVTANEEIAGYIAPDVLKSDVLPLIRGASNYGGVMIWDRYYDKLSGYSEKIKDSVGKTCRCVCDDELASINFFGLKARPFPM